MTARYEHIKPAGEDTLSSSSLAASESLRNANGDTVFGNRQLSNTQGRVSDFVPGDLIVGFKDENTAQQTVDQMLKDLGIQGTSSRISPGMFLVNMSQYADVLAIGARMKKEIPGVKFAEPAFYLHLLD